VPAFWVPIPANNLEIDIMNISKSNAAKLGAVLADSLSLCDNAEQRAGVCKARDLISDNFSPQESERGWQLFLAFTEGLDEQLRKHAFSGAGYKLFEDFTLDNGVKLSAFTLGDRVHFQGSSTGDHSVRYDGDFNRVAAHWQGYKNNAEQAYERWVNRDR